ncbi:hypothetical protein EJ05DRAFT_328680 [Pseudovirgaria hyperparasitica]|uniref:Uncharacterized protein n=1 Tax=Pseudovirgaria hyperparasitica TaxID=470096 RepID=A0A6A6WBM0_9PEZI|nr:uncharacterized protein EJ05DRAFT_328680 [Pseudovirgaria hyperparasitica]KAF2758997.1 hypothetical protein EJ05DRAFT_328680 [Pseudovirgaria hyperparasitica]
MAAVTAGYDWPRSSPMQHSSSDTASPVFPERPIRPLPKRRLRNRLSPEQADSIVFPPAPPSSAQLFSFPYSSVDRGNSASFRPPRASQHQHTCNCGHHNSDIESEYEEDHPISYDSSPTADRSFLSARSNNKGPAITKALSTTSSADGYESFENTNNKKKRKIPNTSSSSSQQTNLSAEMAGMGLSPNGRHAVDDLEDGHVRASPSAAAATTRVDMSGAGRGRNKGRPHGQRVSGANTVSMGSGSNGAMMHGQRQAANDPDSRSQGGIISTAIANAQAQPPLAEDGIGIGSTSLLQKQASRSSPNAGQFTFTVESESANRMVWPGQAGAYPPGVDTPEARRLYDANRQTTGRSAVDAGKRPVHEGSHRNMTAHGTQSGPAVNGAYGAKQQYAEHPPPHGAAPNQQAPSPRKPRRSPAKQYEIAARQRKIQQDFTNWHHPPRREDMWICEFCEYEAIFGRPPRALIYQYEKKDKQERKRLAEKRRLLEKARMKGKRGKKGSKNSKANNGQQTNATNAHHTQVGDENMRTHPDDPSQQMTQEEYYSDELDDGGIERHDLDSVGHPHHKGHRPAPNTGQAPGPPIVGPGKGIANGA